MFCKSVCGSPCPLSGEILDHSSHPRRKKESNRSQYTHQHKHPEEYPVKDHGHILPVFFHLAEKRHSRGRHFKISHKLSFYQLSVLTLHWFLSNGCFFFIRRRLSPKCQSILAHLSYSRSNYTGPIFPKMGTEVHCSPDNDWCQWMQQPFCIYFILE